MSLINKLFDILLGVLRDSPPEFAFEIAADRLAVSRTRQPAAGREITLTPGVVEPSPVKENIPDPVAFTDAIRKLVPPASGGGRRTAAIVLPDSCVRISVLDFDALPEKEEELRALIHFRLRKSVPFEIDEAALSYFHQAGNNVLVALAPAEIVAHYEAPFRAAGLNPGLVTVSSLAMLELVPKTGSYLVARVSPGALTVLAVKDGAVTIARSLELTSNTADPLEEISADIYPTIAYIEDQSGSRPEKLLLAGFGDDAQAAARRLSVELDLPVDVLPQTSPGLAGYLARLDSRVNLAREPFRRDRPMLVGSAVAATLLVATLILMIFMAKSDRREIAASQVELAQVNSQMAGLLREQTNVDAGMRQAGNAVVLDRSILINTLIRRKAISWTRIFGDLQKVLPHNVRLVAVRPQVNGQDQLFLDMTVAADTPEPVIAFIAELEGSDVFGSTAVSGITPPTQTDPFYRYRLSVNYAQKL
jgi:Tfp pilus assembly protein PilN